MEERTLADAAQLSSLADETLRRGIVVLAKQRYLRERDLQSLHATFVPLPRKRG